MIKISRGEEPEGLAAARARGLARVRAAVAENTLRSEDFAGYELVKEGLWCRQHQKCAYCETREQAMRNDVEHFRPKARADRRPGSSATHGYFWLAWTWDNLLFACRNCNQPPAKHDKFPLAAGSVALQPEEQPPGGEIPLLIDPAVDNPSEHIELVEDCSRPQRPRWIPRARAGSLRGDWTIRVCRLDRPDLVTLYTAHVKKEIRPLVDRIVGLAEKQDATAIRREWDWAKRRLLAPSQVYAALARDALAKLVAPELRQRWGLQLPAPA